MLLDLEKPVNDLLKDMEEHSSSNSNMEDEDSMEREELALGTRSAF